IVHQGGITVPNIDEFAFALCENAELATVAPAPTALSTQASPTVLAGGAISDSATLSGGFGTLTGTLTFKAFALARTIASCIGLPAFAATVPVSGTGTYGSGAFTPSAAGTYAWYVTYSGDSNNAGSSSPCNAPNESTIVTKATTAVTTQVSSS